MKRIFLVLLTALLALNVFVLAASADSASVSDIEKAIVEKAKESKEELNEFSVIFIKLDGEDKTIDISGRYTVEVEKDGKTEKDSLIWDESYEIDDETYLELLEKAGSETVYDAYNAESSVSKEISDVIVKLINPEKVAFVYYGFGENGMARNLKYMGLGMLGIFVVVGVVILVTFILNSITSRKKN